ncbi:hypothetical protein [Edaphobacter aggregans]|uniref:hypothetical protein n=1 Tax=Edaphobacter aggregans TaxID=570835 RepID=UPI0005521822|nr:hypothetical protein [Edaphobacter aggregans]
MRMPCRAAVVLGAAVALASGCNKRVDNTIHFTDAINTYYTAHPECLWKTPVKFPVQADTSDTSKTTPYDALVDQGLLVRTTDQKTVMVVASKQVNNYDLSEKGRAAWMADTDQPGFGNFCYGRRRVTSIDSSTPTSNERGATTQVSYHYTVADTPAWATAEETKNAYPQIRADLEGTHTGQAILIETNEGWKLARTGPIAPAPAPSGS